MQLRSMYAFVAVGSLSLLTGADWPQWRGPERNGVSQETGLLQAWPAEGPKLLWRQGDVGFGYSTPAVVGDRLYLLSNRGEDEFVQAHAVADGALIWATRIGKVGNLNQNPPYPGARSTPTVEGGALYALGSDGDLVCLETATGKPRWTKNVRQEFGGKPGIWAYSESPLVDGDLLVCTPGGAEATLVGLDKKSGDVVWKTALPTGDEAGYASAIPLQWSGVKQYVQFLQKGLTGIDAQTGQVLWRYEKTASNSMANIPTPVAHKGYVYSASGRGGAGLVKLTTADQKIEAEEVYFTPKLPTAIGGSVLIGDYLYGTGGRATICAEFTTGDIKWTNAGIGAASLLYADRRLYLHGENGDVALLEATPEAYREKGRFTPPQPPERGSSKAWAYPVVANGRLYIRELGVLWCFDIASPK